MEWLVKVLIVTALFDHCSGRPVLLTDFASQHTSDSASVFPTTPLNSASTPSSHIASIDSGQDSVSTTSDSKSLSHEESATQSSATESQALMRQTSIPSSSSSSSTTTASFSSADVSGTQSDHNDSVIKGVREVNRPSRVRILTNRDILIQRIVREVHLYTNTMRGQHDSETNTGLGNHRGRDGDAYHDEHDKDNPNAANNSNDGHINNDDDKVVDRSSSNDTDIRPDNDNSKDNDFETEDDDGDITVLSHDQLVDVILKDSSFTDASLRQDLANMSRDSLLNLLHELSRLRSAATGFTSTPVYTDTEVMQPQQLQNKTYSLSSLSIGDICCSVG